MWKSPQGSQEVQYNLPKDITGICFIESDYNLEFQSDKFYSPYNVKHLDAEKMLRGRNEYCVDSIKKKISLTIKKDFGDDLVYIE